MIAVGPGRHDDKGILIPMQVKVDDMVIFDYVTAYPINIAGETYYTMREHELFTKVLDNEERKRL